MEKPTRNTLAGSKAGKSKSAKYFQSNPEAREKKNEYNKRYHASDERKKYRAELNKANKEAKTYGNKDGKDMSHTKSGKMIREAASKNRARQGKDGKSTKK
jgi:hypothetical protein